MTMAGLYVHIPFCHSKCAYCDFYSMPLAKSSAIDQFVDALIDEYEQRRGSLQFSTIYIGGGTPSILSIDALKRIVTRFPKDIEEFSLEANPEDVTEDKAEAWREMGINRISMGVQSLVDSELLAIGRRHCANDAISAVDTIKKVGFTNFSLDLIYGLPDQSLASWEFSLRSLLALEPAHFSAYMMSYEPRTRLTAMLKTGKIKETPEDIITQMYRMLCEIAKEKGYEHYEISNFCKPGMGARHNSSYWTGEPYLGIGPAAHSFDGSNRSYNVSSLKDYLAGAEAEIDHEEECNRFNDKVMTALRTAKGLDLSEVDVNRQKQLLQDAAKYVRSGDLLLADHTLRIPEASWLISDDIISSLFQLI